MMRRIGVGALASLVPTWSFTTLSVAAKNVMSSVPDYLLIETAFTIVQWALVGPLMALALAKVHSGVKGPLGVA